MELIREDINGSKSAHSVASLSSSLIRVHGDEILIIKCSVWFKRNSSVVT